MDLTTTGRNFSSQQAVIIIILVYQTLIEPISNFATVAECPSLTGKHLVFGRVVGRESIDTVRTIENTQVNYGVPDAQCV
jgi:cyclophilin family peptidyl-prolyl cis-trans isomerase